MANRKDDEKPASLIKFSSGLRSLCDYASDSDSATEEERTPSAGLNSPGILADTCYSIFFTLVFQTVSS